jgi:hypothetical protein
MKFDYVIGVLEHLKTGLWDIKDFHTGKCRRIREIEQLQQAIKILKESEEK